MVLGVRVKVAREREALANGVACVRGIAAREGEEAGVDLVPVEAGTTEDFLADWARALGRRAKREALEEVSK